MKRKDLAKRSLALLLATSMALSSSLTVMADDTDIVSTNHENTIEVYDGLTVEVFGWSIVDHDSDDFSGVNSKDAQYHDNEAAKVEAASKSVQDMEAQVKIAQDAAKEAATAVEALETEIANLNTAEEAVTTESTNATEAATDATKAATDATAAVEAVNDSVTSEASDYNKQVIKDQEAVDAIETNKATTEGAVSIEDINTPSAEDENVAKIVADTKTLADAAAAEAEAAKTALENALAVETDVVNEEVEAYVGDALDAALNAKAAADAAEKIYNNANDALTAAIKEYDLYAMMYGEPLYGKTEKTYTDDEAKAALIKAGMMTATDNTQAGIAAELNSDVVAINDVDLSSYENAIETAETNLATAETNFNTAKTDAETAMQNINDAIGTIDEKSTAADAAFNAVADYYVAPAKAALDTTTQTIKSKTTEQSQKATELENAKTAATPAAEQKYNTEVGKKDQNVKDAEKAYYDAKDDYDDMPGWRFIEKLFLEGKMNDAKDAWDDAVAAYNNYVAAKNSNIADYINDTQSVKDAATALTNVTNEINALNNTKASQKETLEQAEATKSAYMAAYKNKTEEQFRKEIAEAIKPLSDEINQTEYDKVVNDFVNDSFNSWAFLTKDIVRGKMNDKYEEFWYQKLVNALGVTQWGYDTDNADETIANTQNACKKAIESYLENICLAEANWAADSAAASKTAKDTKMNAVDLVAQQTALSSAATAVSDAKAELAEAKETYNDAKVKLTKLQGQVKDIKLDDIKLGSINAALEKAKKAVADAKDAVDDAKAAQTAAENFAAWAQELVKEHQMVVYSQVVGEDAEEPEFTPVTTLNEDKAEVPYEIYRAYVDAMYEEYKFDKRGDATIVTPENMKVLFWELDANGNLTGVYYDDENKLPASGRYFVGYAFGYDEETYRLEGKMYDYVKPSNGGEPSGDVPGEPEGDVPGEPQGPDDYTPVPVNGRPGSTSNADALAAYYAALAAMNNGNGGNVLGVNRQERAVAVPEAEVLGEKKDTENTIIDEKKNVAEDDKPVVKIEDTPVPLANSLTEEEKAGMSWWWLLLVAVLGTAGVVAYREYQKKKAVVKTESKKNDKKTNAK